VETAADLSMVGGGHGGDDKARHVPMPPGSDLKDPRWQDDISTGFDRLVAYATEVDNRRKSNDSGPSQPGSSGGAHRPPPHEHRPSSKLPMSAASPLEHNKNTMGGGLSHPSQVPPPPPPPPDFDRMSALSMKFKRAATGSYASSGSTGGGLGGLPQRVSTSTSSPTKRSGLSATASIPPELLMGDDEPGGDEADNRRASATPSSSEGGKIPGENLPEHHFKKRYFAASRQQTTSMSSTGSGSGGGETIFDSVVGAGHSQVHKKRPSLLGSSRQMSRSSPELDEDVAGAGTSDSPADNNPKPN